MDNLNNSFYYFFSSAPQVLGGILALFGVFVIFKIQILRNSLIGIGNTICEESKSRLIMSSFKVSTKRLTNAVIIDDLSKAINTNDLSEIHKIILEVDNPQFKELKQDFNFKNDFLHQLILRTIIWSFFTGIVIVFYLTSITLGPIILKNYVLAYCLFLISIILIIICFHGFITILIKSLTETSFRPLTGRISKCIMKKFITKNPKLCRD